MKATIKATESYPLFRYDSCLYVSKITSLKCVSPFVNTATVRCFSRMNFFEANNEKLAITPKTPPNDQYKGMKLSGMGFGQLKCKNKIPIQLKLSVYGAQTIACPISWMNPVIRKSTNQGRIVFFRIDLNSVECFHFIFSIIQSKLRTKIGVMI